MSKNLGDMGRSCFRSVQGVVPLLFTLALFVVGSISGEATSKEMDPALEYVRALQNPYGCTGTLARVKNFWNGFDPEMSLRLATLAYVFRNRDKPNFNRVGAPDKFSAIHLETSPSHLGLRHDNSRLVLQVLRRPQPRLQAFWTGKFLGIDKITSSIALADFEWDFFRTERPPTGNDIPELSRIMRKLQAQLIPQFATVYRQYFRSLMDPESGITNVELDTVDSGEGYEMAFITLTYGSGSTNESSPPPKAYFSIHPETIEFYVEKYDGERVSSNHGGYTHKGFALLASGFAVRSPIEYTHIWIDPPKSQNFSIGHLLERGSIRSTRDMARPDWMRLIKP